jgi:hypothetical protein
MAEWSIEASVLTYSGGTAPDSHRTSLLCPSWAPKQEAGLYHDPPPSPKSGDGFHSLDFPFLYYKRPLWDLIVILLSAGGVAISVTSALPAWRRILRLGRPWVVRGERQTRQVKAQPSAGPAAYP